MLLLQENEIQSDTLEIDTLDLNMSGTAGLSWAKLAMRKLPGKFRER